MTFFKEKPEIPPTPAAEAPANVVNFMDIFKVFKENRNFSFLVIVFCLKQGTLNSMGTLLSDIFTPYDFDAKFIASLGLIFLASGIIGAVGMSIIIDRTHAFKTSFVFLCAAITLTMF